MQILTNKHLINFFQYETYVSTLRQYPDTLLGTMFQERNKNLLKPINDNEYFFDRNGRAFHYIMEYYRTGECLWNLSMGKTENGALMTRKEFEKEMDYFQISYSNQALHEVRLAHKKIISEIMKFMEEQIYESMKSFVNNMSFQFSTDNVIRNGGYQSKVDHSYNAIMKVHGKIIESLENKIPDIKCSYCHSNNYISISVTLKYDYFVNDSFIG